VLRLCAASDDVGRLPTKAGHRPLVDGQARGRL
jgi:hypothetical protein